MYRSVHAVSTSRRFTVFEAIDLIFGHQSETENGELREAEDKVSMILNKKTHLMKTRAQMTQVLMESSQNKKKVTYLTIISTYDTQCRAHREHYQNYFEAFQICCIAFPRHQGGFFGGAEEVFDESLP